MQSYSSAASGTPVPCCRSCRAGHRAGACRRIQAPPVAATAAGTSRCVSARITHPPRPAGGRPAARP
jgi:hypothetical protein